MNNSCFSIIGAVFLSSFPVTLYAQVAVSPSLQAPPVFDAISSAQSPSPANERPRVLTPIFGAGVGTGLSMSSKGTAGGTIQLGKLSTSYLRVKNQFSTEDNDAFKLEDASFHGEYLNLQIPKPLSFSKGSGAGLLLTPSTNSLSLQSVGYIRRTHSVSNGGQAGQQAFNKDSYFYRAGVSFASFSESDSRSAPYGAILDFAAGPKLRFNGCPDYVVDQEKGTQPFEYGLDFGVSIRQVLGAITTDNEPGGQSVRSQVFGTNRSTFLGGEATLYFNTGNATPFLRLSYFPYSDQMKGFSGVSAFIGLNVVASIKKSSRSVPTTGNATHSTTTGTSP